MNIAPHMHLVYEVMARIITRLPKNVRRDDLVQAGSLGLIDALLKQNGQATGPTFEWYARIRVRGAILDELRSQDWLTRRARNAVTKAERAAVEGAAPSLRTAVVSLDDLAPDVRARLSIDDAPLADEQCIEGESDAHVRAAVAQLPERERRIVEGHHFDGKPFKAIAYAMGVSEPRVSQLHARALELLRALLAGGEPPPARPTPKVIEVERLPEVVAVNRPLSSHCGISSAVPKRALTPRDRARWVRMPMGHFRNALPYSWRCMGCRAECRTKRRFAPRERCPLCHRKEAAQ